MPNTTDIADSLRRSPIPANAALALAILLAAFALAKIVWLVLSGPALPAIAPDAITLPVQANKPRATVAQWHLFGNAAAPAINAKLAAVEETTLKLTLRGTLNETSPNGGLAIVADENGTDDSYRVGDTLPGGGKLLEIHQARVLFERNGKVESLSLPREATRLASSSRSASASTSGNRNAASSLPPITGNMAAVPAFPSVGGIAPGMPSLESLKASTGIDPAQLAKQVQVFPVFANGKMRGVRLAAARDSSLLESTGLKPTDLITAVNGIPLDGPQRQSQLVSSLGRGRVEVELERDGKPMKLSIGL